MPQEETSTLPSWRSDWRSGKVVKARPLDEPTTTRCVLGVPRKTQDFSAVAASRSSVWAIVSRLRAARSFVPVASGENSLMKPPR